MSWLECTHCGKPMALFGEGGGQMLADELDVPLLAKVPLSTELREHADNGKPLVIEDPDAPASQMIREAARGIVAATPVELPLLQGASAAPAAAPASNGGGIRGTELPMVQ
jgi:ATP-binding protein involved in chromosome partitioning